MAYLRRIVNSSDIRGGVWNALERILGGGVSKGTVAGAGVTAVEVAGKTVLTFTNVSVPTVDATTNGAQGSLKIYDFPEGLLQYVGAVASLTVSRVGTAITTTAAVVASVGTAIAGVDATLTGTEADLIPSITATLTAGAGSAVGVSATANTVLFDGTTTAKDAYLNFAIPDAGSTGNDALLVNGTITIAWNLIGDK